MLLRRAEGVGRDALRSCGRRCAGGRGALRSDGGAEILGGRAGRSPAAGRKLGWPHGLSWELEAGGRDPGPLRLQGSGRAARNTKATNIREVLLI